MPLQRRAAPRAEIMGWDGSKWQKLPVESATHPNLRVALYDETRKCALLGYGADGISNWYTQLIGAAHKYVFNESTWDMWRNNTEVTVLASATRTTSGASSDQTNFNARGVIVVVDITAVSGTFATGEGLKLWIAAKDGTSGKRFAISPVIGPYTASGLYHILIYPGTTDTAARITAENDIPLPRTWNVTYDITGTNPSFTFSVGASYII